jgi:FlaA1/EpsC-like NDP-sugar epimerase
VRQLTARPRGDWYTRLVGEAAERRLLVTGAAGVIGNPPLCDRASRFAAVAGAIMRAFGPALGDE